MRIQKKRKIFGTTKETHYLCTRKRETFYTTKVGSVAQLDRATPF